MGTNKRTNERRKRKNPHDDKAVGESLYSMRLNARDCVPWCDGKRFQSMCIGTFVARSSHYFPI